MNTSVRSCAVRSGQHIAAGVRLVVAQEKDAPADAHAALSSRYEDLKWQAIVPELGNDSQQISVVHIDPKTHATQLFIRTHKKMHVPMHWHNANETHTMVLGTAVFEHEGKREKLGAGGFHYIPAKMPHQAWTPKGRLFSLLLTARGT